MTAIITGIVVALIGAGNLTTGRMHPERINARLQRGMGYIGLVIGTLIVLNGLVMVVRPPR